MADRHLELKPAGDRLRVRLRHLDAEAAGPLVIVYASDGDSENAELDEVFDQLSPWCTIAAPDLPLCGARSSDKLSAAAFDPQHALSNTLLSDIRLQLRDDLKLLLAALAEPRRVDQKRSAVLACGRAALAFADWKAAENALSRIECVADPAQLLDAARALRAPLES